MDREVKSPQIYRSFNCFIESKNSDTNETENENNKLKKKKEKRRKSKILPYSQLTLKQKEKRIKNMNHFMNGHSEYPA
ncbi:hypothetical protein [Maribellus mangrovi]|uniref:hypothetical protein n=1 Tax=Maribellus mangrovi TaxID=3133146 RepID=UPI0030EB2958